MGYTRRDRIIRFISKKNTKLVESMERDGLSPEGLDKYLENLAVTTKLNKQNVIRSRIVGRKLRESYGNI